MHITSARITVLVLSLIVIPSYAHAGYVDCPASKTTFDTNKCHVWQCDANTGKLGGYSFKQCAWPQTCITATGSCTAAPADLCANKPPIVESNKCIKQTCNSKTGSYNQFITTCNLPGQGCNPNSGLCESKCNYTKPPYDASLCDVWQCDANSGLWGYAAKTCSNGQTCVPSAGCVTATQLSFLSALKSNNLATIDATFCQSYNKNPQDPNAAFGCAMVTAAKLIDAKTANINLSDFFGAIGEPSTVNIQSDILDPANTNSLCSQMAATPKEKYCGNFPGIPFNSWCDNKVWCPGSGSWCFSKAPGKGYLSYSTLKPNLKKVLLSLKQKNIPISQLQNDLFALDSALASINNMLATSKNSANFGFTIPAGFCQFKKDHNLNKLDAEGFYVLFSLARVTANLLHSYTVGLDLTKFVDNTGGVIKTDFVTDANGGADGKKFAELISGLGNLSFLQSFIQDALASTTDALSNIKTKNDSVIFGRPMTSTAYQSGLQKINNMVKDLLASMQQNTMTPLINSKKPNDKVDLNKGLANLPDPKTVTSADPFVIDGKTGKIKVVPSFFKTLLSGIAEF